MMTATSELQECAVLVTFLIKHAFESIHPNANFPRRVTALSILDLVYRQRILQVGEKSELRQNRQVDVSKMNRCSEGRVYF